VGKELEAEKFKKSPSPFDILSVDVWFLGLVVVLTIVLLIFVQK
jgi:hypothetical protein